MEKLNAYDTKFLGVIISYNLSWNKHIDVVLNKASKTVGIIAKVRHLLPPWATRTLYLTLVEPYIKYSNIVWAQPEPTVKFRQNTENTKEILSAYYIFSFQGTL